MKKGYTVIEFCIVVTIMIMLSIFIVPQLSQATIETKTEALDHIVTEFQNQIKLYRKDHNGSLPRLDRISFQQALCGHTDKFGDSYESTSENIGLKKCGPYFNQIPANPFNEKNSVRINGPSAGRNTHGWRYDSGTGEIKSDFPIKTQMGSLK